MVEVVYCDIMVVMIKHEQLGRLQGVDVLFGNKYMLK